MAFLFTQNKLWMFRCSISMRCNWNLSNCNQFVSQMYSIHSINLSETRDLRDMITTQSQRLNMLCFAFHFWIGRRRKRNSLLSSTHSNKSIYWMITVMHMYAFAYTYCRCYNWLCMWQKINQMRYLFKLYMYNIMIIWWWFLILFRCIYFARLNFNKVRK